MPVTAFPVKPETTPKRIGRWWRETRNEAAKATTTALAIGSEFQAQLAEIVSECGEALPPGLPDRARRLAEHLEREIAAMTLLIERGTFR